MNALRGAIVVIVAIVIAVVILARGLDDADVVAPDGTTGTTAATTTTGAAPPPPEPAPTPPEPAPQPPAAAPQPAPAPTPDDIPPDLEPAGDLVASTPTPPPASPVHNRSEVRVLVANGTAVCGAAGKLATTLSAQGFNVLSPVNADNPADASVLYYVEEYGADAGVVASLLQVDSSRVLPMGSSPPTAPGDAHVLVHIGADDLAQPNC